MNDLSNKYALAALKNTRATLAAEIMQLERQLRHRRESLVHVDATLRLLDGSIEPGTIPTKRLTKRVKLFRHGQLGRMIRDALREGKGPLAASEIVTALLKVGGHAESARPTIGPRVRGNLAYLERQGVAVRTGRQKDARWRLV